MPGDGRAGWTRPVALKRRLALATVAFYGCCKAAVVPVRVSRVRVMVHASAGRGVGGRRTRRAVSAFSIVAALAVAGCASDPTDKPPPTSAIAPGVPVDAIVGRWGVGSFHRDQDRARTEIIARQQCSNPYTIGRGQSGGVVMHLPDQREPQELRVKGAPGGRTFIGPEGPPGGEEDREVIAFSGGVMTMRYIDPDDAKRFGTMVYARCPG